MDPRDQFNRILSLRPPSIKRISLSDQNTSTFRHFRNLFSQRTRHRIMFNSEFKLKHTNSFQTVWKYLDETWQIKTIIYEVLKKRLRLLQFINSARNYTWDCKTFWCKIWSAFWWLFHFNFVLNLVWLKFDRNQSKSELRRNGSTIHFFLLILRFAASDCFLLHFHFERRIFGISWKWRCSFTSISFGKNITSVRLPVDFPCFRNFFVTKKFHRFRYFTFRGLFPDGSEV